MILEKFWHNQRVPLNHYCVFLPIGINEFKRFQYNHLQSRKNFWFFDLHALTATTLVRIVPVVSHVALLLFEKKIKIFSKCRTKIFMSDEVAKCRTKKRPLNIAASCWQDFRKNIRITIWSPLTFIPFSSELEKNEFPGFTHKYIDWGTRNFFFIVFNFSFARSRHYYDAPYGLSCTPTQLCCVLNFFKMLHENDGWSRKMYQKALKNRNRVTLLVLRKLKILRCPNKFL